MKDKPFFEIKGWLDILTYVSVVLMPIFFILCAFSNDGYRESFKDFALSYFIISYWLIYAAKSESILRNIGTVFMWILGVGAIIAAFPLWTLAIYLICPVIWVIREIWRTKHER